MSKRPTDDELLALLGEDEEEDAIIVVEGRRDVINLLKYGIKNVILDFYNRWKQGTLKTEVNWDVIKKYSRKELTKKLAEIFDDVSEK